MDIKVSIIVPVYNCEKYIRQCVESLLHQSLEEIEILLVDDASTDKTAMILQQYELANAKKLKVYSFTKNQKQGAARNYALQKANGEYVLFVDSDDWIENETCELLYHEAQRTESDIVFCDYYMSEEQNMKRYERHVRSQFLGDMTVAKRKALLTTSVVPWAKLIKRSLIIDNDIYFPEGYSYEDQATTYLYYLYAQKTSKLDRALYYYRVAEGSTTTTLNNKRHFQHMDMALLLLKRMQQRGFDSIYKEEMDYFLFEQMYILGVLNSLRQFTEPQTEYLEQLLSNLLLYCPDYEKNNYYRKYVSEKYKKIISLHRKSVNEMLEEIACGGIGRLCDNYMLSIANNEAKLQLLFEHIKKHKKTVALWGAGKNVLYFVNCMERWGYRFDVIVDKDESKWNSQYGSYIVSNTEAAIEMDYIIVPYGGWMYSVKEILIGLGYKGKILDLELWVKHDLDIPLEDYME